MKKEPIELMLKVSLSKVIKKCRKKERKQLDDCFVVFRKDTDECEVYKENLIGKENRKYPQLIKLYTLNRGNLEGIITLINNAYIKHPLELGGLVKTITHHAYINLMKQKDSDNKLTIKNGEYILEKESIQIDNITIVESDSILYKFREKPEKVRMSKTKKHEEKQVHELVLVFKKYSLSIVKQSYDEIMYKEYTVFCKIDNKVKEFTFVKNPNGKYVSTDKKLSIDPSTMRILNLRIRNEANIGKIINNKLIEFVYAKPII